MNKFPIQPIEDHRFVANKIVLHLLDDGPFDMNTIAMRNFPREDREQFAQLIGYSLSGASELDYMTDETLEAANKIDDEGISEDQARIAVLRGKLDNVRKHIKEACAGLFAIHPDDLEE